MFKTLGFMFLVLFILKTMELLHWSWAVIILAPLWMPLLFVLSIIVCTFVTAIALLLILIVIGLLAKLCSK